MTVGDRVEKRGLPGLGTVVKSKDGRVTVDWDDGPTPRFRPRICSEKELRRFLP